MVRRSAGFPGSGIMGAVDFNWPLIVGGALALGFAGFAGLQLVRLPRVWRGETVIPLPRSNLYLPEVNHRSFPVFVGSIVFVAAGAMLVFVAVLVDARALAVIGLICATIGFRDHPPPGAAVRTLSLSVVSGIFSI